jgi:iron complex outermembrane receptor protein
MILASRFYTSTVLASMMFAAPALAQEAPQAAPAAAAPSGGIEEIVVTAQKRSENLQKTPIAITALTAQALQTSGIRDITGVVQATPSLYFAPYPSSSTTLVLYMRGQGVGDPNVVTSDGGVGLYVDGFYQARPQASTFDLADVERVEVLRGPQGTLYGRNTTGGAVNIITKKPTGEFGATGQLSLGNYGYKRALVNLDLPAFGPFSVKLTGLYSNRDGWAKNAKDTSGVPAAHDFQTDHKLAFRGAVRFQPTDDITFDYAGDYADQRTTPVRYVTENALGPVVTPGYDGNVKRAYRPVYLPYSHVKSDGHSLTGEFRVSDSLTLRSLTGYRHIDVDSYQDYTESFLAPFMTVDRIKSKVFTQELQAVGDFGDQLKYVVGLYYFHEKVSHLQQADAGTGTPDQLVLIDRMAHAKSTSKAAFGQITWTPDFTDGKFDVTLGARYTVDKRTATLIRDPRFYSGEVSPLISRRFLDVDFDSLPQIAGAINGATRVKNKKFNPSLTLSYRPTENVSTYAKVVTGYKAGGSNEASPTFTRTYNPETVTSYEVGLKTDLLDRRLRINLAGYVAKYKDLQLNISANAADPSLADTFNAGRATVKGLEADITAVPFEGLTLQANYSYTTSKIRGVKAPAGSIFDPLVSGRNNIQVGDDISGYFVLPFTPKNSLRLSADMNFGEVGPGELAFHVDYTWKDKVFTTAGDGPSIPVGRKAPVNKAYGLVDARLSYSIDRGEGQNITVALWGKNILDKRYPGFVIGSGSILDGYFNQAISYGDPATYGIDVGFSF